MKRKKVITSILVGVAVVGVAVYLFGTKSGQKEAKRLKKTGSATASVFKTLGKEVARNVKAARREEQTRAMKNYLREALAA